jgi:hypothetical protein
MADARERPDLIKQVDNFIRGMANGLTFGAADAIAAAAWTLFGGRKNQNETFRQALQRNYASEDALSAQAQREGTEDREGRIVGSLLLGLGVARALGGFNQAARYRALNKIIDKKGPISATQRADMLTSMDGPYRAELFLAGAAGAGLSDTLSDARRQIRDREKSQSPKPHAPSAGP